MRGDKRNRVLGQLAEMGQAVFWAVIATGFITLWYVDISEAWNGAGNAVWAFYGSGAFVLAALFSTMISITKSIPGRKISLLVFTVPGVFLVYGLSFANNQDWILLTAAAALLFMFCASSLRRLLIPHLEGTENRALSSSISYGFAALFLLLCIYLLYGKSIAISADLKSTLIFGLAALVCIVSSLSVFFLPERGTKPQMIHPKKGDTIQKLFSSLEKEEKGFLLSRSLFFAGAAILMGCGTIFALSLGLQAKQGMFMLFFAFAAACGSVFIYGALERKSAKGTALRLSVCLCLIASLLPLFTMLLQRTEQNALTDYTRSVVAQYAGEKDWTEEKLDMVARQVGQAVLLPERHDKITGKLLSLYHERVLEINDAVDLNERLMEALKDESTTAPYEDTLRRSQIFLYIAAILGGFGLGGLRTMLQTKKIQDHPVADMVFWFAAAAGLLLFGLLCLTTGKPESGFLLAPLCFLVCFGVLQVSERQK